MIKNGSFEVVSTQENVERHLNEFLSPNRSYSVYGGALLISTVQEIGMRQFVIDRCLNIGVECLNVQSDYLSYYIQQSNQIATDIGCNALLIDIGNASNEERNRIDCLVRYRCDSRDYTKLADGVAIVVIDRVSNLDRNVDAPYNVVLCVE